MSIAAKALHILDTHFKNIPSLREIVINFKVYPEEGPSDDLTTKIHNYGWTIKVTEIPKRTYIFADEQVQFDNYEDCQVYDQEQLLISERRRQRVEREEWLEEYQRRRDDPYWKRKNKKKRLPVFYILHD